MHDQRVFGAISDEEDEALGMAIEALEQAPTALDHIHNVVAEREYQRGYEQAKEEYDRKLAEIQSRIKDHCYNKGYKNGMRDAYDWHPLTKESRPPKGGEYLVDFQGMKVGICQYINGHFRNYGEIFDGMITRWTYLPLSEREEKEIENADGQGQVSGELGEDSLSCQNGSRLEMPEMRKAMPEAWRTI